MAAVRPQKVPLTDDLIGSLVFEKRVVGLKPNGAPKTVPTPPTATDWFLRDASMQGFAARVTRKGVRFYAQRKLGGRPCLFDCGTWPETSLTKARKNADMALSKMKLGQDPNLEKKKALAEVADARASARLTFGYMLARDASKREEHDKAGTKKDRRDVGKWLAALPISRMPLRSVKADHLDEMMNTLTQERGATTALKVWRYCRAAFQRLPTAETPPFSPFAEWSKQHDLPRPRRRQTSISTDEKSGRDWLESVASLRRSEGSRGFPDRVRAAYVVLLLCWGSRKMETASLKVVDVDFEREFVVFRDTKNETDHFFPLTKGCAALLRERIADNARPRGRDAEKAARGIPYVPSEWVFPSHRRGLHISNVERVLGVGKDGSGLKVCVHDLRRGFAGAIALDVMVGPDGKATGNFGLVKLAMNHADSKADVTQGYIMIKPKLAMLRRLYEAHEHRVFRAAGLTDLLPPEPPKDEVETLIAALKAGDPAAMRQIRAALGAKTKVTKPGKSTAAAPR